MPLITCMGELLVDFLPLEEAGRTVGFRMHPGGSLLNVAVATRRLGQPVALASRVGTDFFGRYLRSYVEREGVDGRWLLATDAPSTLAFVATDSGDPVFTFYGEGAADTRLTASDLPDALFDETAILHVGSISLLRGSTPGAVLAACRRHSGRALLSLDPNVRPALVGDDTGYRELLRELISLADVVKVSAADLAWLMPGRSLRQAAEALAAQGPALVVVTAGGSAGLAMRAAAGSTESAPLPLAVPVFEVPVLDTVGAGDAFDAGLLTWLAERGAVTRQALLALPEADLISGLRFAAATASLNCTRAGADPPVRSEVEMFLSGANGEGRGQWR